MPADGEGNTITTYYLIDYENVGGDGLTGCSALTQSDHILIFFTQNAKKLDMRAIADHGEAGIKMIEVPAGRQSADIHIGSFLGYLAGKNKGRDCRIIVISRDTDFDNVLQFWEKTTGICAYRMPQIQAETQKKKLVPKQPTENKEEAGRKRLRMALQTALREADFEQGLCDAATELALRCFGAELFTEQVHNALQSKLKDRAKPVYKTMKPVLTVYGKQFTAAEHTPQNSDLLDTLRQAGAKPEEAAFAADKVRTAREKQDAKQQVYRFLVAEYGQDRGLLLYNAIKKKI